MAKILIVDDEPNIQKLIKRFAEHAGYEVEAVSSGHNAISQCRDNDFDVIIMDIMLPDIDGFTTSKEIKKTKDIPILMLSARGAEYDKLLGFESGIDDYMVKPFSPKELFARINVIIKRSHNDDMKSNSILKFDGLEINKLGRTVHIDGERVDLTAKEYELLLYFAENSGVALPREKILKDVWGYKYTEDDRTVDWQIKLLRKKIKEYRRYIITLRGVGYKFEVEN